MNRADRRKAGKSKAKELRQIAINAGARGQNIKRVTRTLKKKLMGG